MSDLYHDLAPVYEAMYQTFMDYPGEHQFYSPFLKSHRVKSLLELGCGTGNMAPLFQSEGIHYTGMDLSEDMLRIARHKYPDIPFFAGNITSFQLPEPVNAVVMFGRTISYLTETEMLLQGFRTTHKNLVKDGLFIFDFIDASRFISSIDPEEIIVHEASMADVHYRRESRWNINLSSGFDVDWDAAYFRLEGEEKVELGKDFSTFRTFTEEEIRILLDLADFVVLEVIDKTSYAFPTKVVVAKAGLTTKPNFQ